MKDYLRIFVYGTLKRGFHNHEWFCSQAINIEPAITWGRLYEIPARFPVLVFPDCSIIEYGTSDPCFDVQVQNNTAIPENAMIRPQGDWDLVRGELMTFANPMRDLPPIDFLEGFQPQGDGFYQRVLGVVESQGVHHIAWIYSGSEHKDMLQRWVRLSKGYWEGCK